MDQVAQDFFVQPDHFCIVVDDLAQAVRNFEALGFTITAGAQSSSAHNALIIFDDGVYIELMHFPKRRLQKALVSLLEPVGLMGIVLSGEKAILRRFLVHWTKAPIRGFVDWCLRAQPLAKALAHARSQGLDMSPEAYTYERPNAIGQTAKWQMGGTLDLSLPFLIEDVAGFSSRTPTSEDHQHANGCTKLISVILTAPNPKKAMQNLEALTGRMAASGVLKIGSVEFHMHPAPGAAELRVYELIFQALNAPQEGERLDPKLTSGARIVLKA